MTVPAYTQLVPNDYSIDVSGFSVGWNEAPIFDDLTIPKSALVDLAAINLRGSANCIMGPRIDGSALARYLNMNEAEAGGGNATLWRVRCHPTTGIIELYDDGVDSDYAYKIVGYWENIDYIEAMTKIAIDVGDENVWTIRTAAAGYPNRVGTFQCVNERAPNEEVGVREVGSGLGRLVNLHEVEPAGANAVNAYGICAKLDGSGDVEVFIDDFDQVFVYYTGAFGPNMDYAELWQTLGISASATWENEDLTTYIDEDGRTVEELLGHTSIGVEMSMGARKNGTGLARLILVHEAEPTQKAVITMTVETDGAGIIEHYITDGAEDWCRLAGYFIPSELSVAEGARGTQSLLNMLLLAEGG